MTSTTTMKIDDRPCSSSHRPLMLIPDKLDDPSNILQSFHDIRNKTLRDLYSKSSSTASTKSFDKSPKGSVDADIQSLVDLLNQHPSFATLSSCSGRIALFDPYASSQRKNDETTTTATTTTTTTTASSSTDTAAADKEERRPSLTTDSGKGRGRWLLASHEQVEPTTLSTLLQHDEEGVSSHQQPMILKFEPLLLHVAASCLKRGQQLLTLALQLGFRESGLVVTEQRVTVAIRGHGLALAVPLARSGPLRPSDVYLESLIQQCNERMQRNHEKLQRLQEAVRENLFRKKGSEASVQYHAPVQSLPSLKLWRQSAVAVPVQEEQPGDVDVYAFGGYGRGPLDQSTGCARSDSIYRLSRRNGNFANEWSVIYSQPPSATSGDEPDSWKTWYGLDVSHATFSKREGSAACMLPLTSSGGKGSAVVAIFGGRTSPESPFNDLFLYEPQTRPDRFMRPVTVQGETPCARWGHTLSCLSGDNGLLAVLVGGRDNKTSFETVHVLSVVTRHGDDDGSRELQWNTLDFSVPACFAHSTTVVDDTVMIFGGYSDPNNLLEGFSPSQANKSRCCAFEIQSSLKVRELTVELTNLSTKELCHWMAGAACVMNSSKSCQILALCGGLLTKSLTQGNSEPIRWLTFKVAEDVVRLNCIRVEFSFHGDTSAKELSSGLLHNCALALPSRNENETELLLIGGGTSAFAFGPIFAGSHHVRLCLDSDYSETFRPRKDTTQAAPAVVDNSSSPSSDKETTDVLYVAKRDAKALKTALEAELLLNKTYRMTHKTMDGESIASNLIAVPVTSACLEIVKQSKKETEPDGKKQQEEEHPWLSLVVDYGSQQVPYSSSVWGKRQSKRR